MAVIVNGNVKTLKKVVCSCGNETDFRMTWLGDVPQSFGQFEDGERDFDSHSNEGENTNIEFEIVCGQCDTIVAERDIVITVGPWSVSRKPFLVVVQTEFVRDTQIADHPDVFDLSDQEADKHWSDTTGEHVLGQFWADTVGDALKQAAEKCGMPMENLAAYPLAYEPELED